MLSQYFSFKFNHLKIITNEQHLNQANQLIEDAVNEVVLPTYAFVLKQCLFGNIKLDCVLK